MFFSRARIRGTPKAVCSRAAFSLIELSVVVAIISIVAVAGLELAATFLNRTAYQRTQERIAQVDAAIAQYYNVYRRLPCPARPDLARTAPCYGKENRNGANNCGAYTTACSAPYLFGSATNQFGDVPVRDLGLPLSAMLDGYGNKITYVATSTLAIPLPVITSLGALEVRSGKQATSCTGAANCQIRANPLDLNVGGAAYVLFSHGRNARGARSPNGGIGLACLPDTTADNAIDTVNCRLDTNLGIGAALGSNVFYDSIFNSGTREDSFFDDVVRWRLKSSM
jgi:prepilin-type N-terminal cleavage/methylation domain-containing protein